MKIIAIDPGNKDSAWLVYQDGLILDFKKESNLNVLIKLNSFQADHLVVEMIASYGMAVGAEVFDTVLWIGRFIERWDKSFSLMYRKDVKMHLCGTMKAKDANIRQTLIDRFGGPGTKKAPGMTYGISADIWSALAIAVTYRDTKK